LSKKCILIILYVFVFRRTTAYVFGPHRRRQPASSWHHFHSCSPCSFHWYSSLAGLRFCFLRFSHNSSPLSYATRWCSPPDLRAVSMTVPGKHRLSPPQHTSIRRGSCCILDAEGGTSSVRCPLIADGPVVHGRAGSRAAAVCTSAAVFDPPTPAEAPNCLSRKAP